MAWFSNPFRHEEKPLRDEARYLVMRVRCGDSDADAIAATVRNYPHDVTEADVRSWFRDPQVRRELRAAREIAASYQRQAEREDRSARSEVGAGWTKETFSNGVSRHSPPKPVRGPQTPPPFPPRGVPDPFAVRDGETAHGFIDRLFVWRG